MIQVQGGMGSSPSKKKDDEEVENNEEDEEMDQEHRDESIENEGKTYQSKETQFEELTRKLSRPDLIAELKRVSFFFVLFLYFNFVIRPLPFFKLEKRRD